MVVEIATVVTTGLLIAVTPDVVDATVLLVPATERVGAVAIAPQDETVPVLLEHLECF